MAESVGEARSGLGVVRGVHRRVRGRNARVRRGSVIGVLAVPVTRGVVHGGVVDGLLVGGLVVIVVVRAEAVDVGWKR